jgi:hypothetical protein
MDGDFRPEWVKQVMALRPQLIGRPEGNGRWSFEPYVRDQRLASVEVHHRKNGDMVPVIWSGEKWLDLREPEGRALHQKHYGEGQLDSWMPSLMNGEPLLYKGVA